MVFNVGGKREPVTLDVTAQVRGRRQALVGSLLGATVCVAGLLGMQRTWGFSAFVFGLCFTVVMLIRLVDTSVRLYLARRSSERDGSGSRSE